MHKENGACTRDETKIYLDFFSFSGKFYNKTAGNNNNNSNDNDNDNDNDINNNTNIYTG